MDPTMLQGLLGPATVNPMMLRQRQAMLRRLMAAQRLRQMSPQFPMINGTVPLNGLLAPRQAPVMPATGFARG